jgi:ERCC4-type nuclease
MAILLSSRGVEFAERALPSGDYAILDTDGCTLGLERKTSRDLVHTFGTVRATDGLNRLYSQMERMRFEYTCSILLLEGSLGYEPLTGKVAHGSKGDGWNHGAIIAALLAVQLRYGTHLIPVADKLATIDALRMLAERAAYGCVLKSQKENRDEKSAVQDQAGSAVLRSDDQP